MKILITGSQGFIGSSFGRVAASAGHEVLGVARSNQSARDWPGEHVSADAASADMAGLVRDFCPDMFVHCAGTASVGASFNTPVEDLRASVLTWANALESIRRSGVNCTAVFPSSAAVYGNPLRLPLAEDAPVAPISPYGFHKAACELVAREYGQCFNLSVLVCRLFSVFGPAQRRLLVWELYRQFAGESHDAHLEGTGEETRDYLYVDDAVEACLRASEAQRGRPGRLTVNIASGQETKVIHLAEKMQRLVAPEKPVFRGEHERRGDPQRWRADTGLLRSLAPQWRPRALDEGLKQCVEAWREQDR